ncbi:MAG: hypothetical protein JRF60_14475, partial [Deltaproteobacteria bacterium]|nr:hypothetical protein [Deltaproteobacteria bacterium]
MKKPDIDLKKSSEPLFEKIEKLTKVQRILVCSGIFLVIIGSFVYFSYLPKIKIKKNLNKEIQKKKKKLTIARKNARDLKKYQNKI